MAFLSPLGLGAQLISRRRRPHSSRVLKPKVVNNRDSSRFQLKPHAHGQKRKQQLEEELTPEKKSSRSSIFNFNDDVAIEILSRLPVKSLMRFKCVCKYWLFLIEQDMPFINLHLERSRARPGLLIASFIEDKNNYQFRTADLLFGNREGGAVSAATFHTVREVDFRDCDLMLRPVNGLTGFFGKGRIRPGVCIINLSTREVSPWIKSKVLRDVRKKDREKSKYFQVASCTLGYDPTSKEHKVVGIWGSSRPSYEVCEVLTIGDNEWRQIDEVPPHSLELNGSSIYINGSIYYTTEFLSISEADEKDESKFIVAFDVGREKFRAIRVPSYIFEQPEIDDSPSYFYDIMLLELDSRLGLLIILENRGCNHTPKLWVLNEDRNKKNSRSSWTEVTIQLPYTLDEHRDFACDPVSGTDQMILTSYVETSDGKVSDSTCHSYDWKKKTLNEIEFSGISSVPYLSSTVATFFESLLPVHKCR